MQTEPMENEDGYRVWLSANEQDTLIEYYDEDLDKQLAVRLGLLGLRASEIVNVAREDIRRLDSDDEAYKLKIQDSKTGYRETPLPRETKQQIQMLSSAKNLKKDEPVIEQTKRSVQRWISSASSSLADEPEEPDEWEHLSAHDLRRTWCTWTYWQLGASDRSKDIIMRWGGWTDEQTFSQNYLGREPDDLAAEMMEKSNLR